MKKIIYSYLIKSNEGLFISRSNSKITNLDIKNEIEQFIENNPNSYGFPQNFL
jgi:hypothetical protein